MFIRGCTQEVRDQLISAFKNYHIGVDEYENGLYDIGISSNIPFVLKYSKPTVKIDIGGKIIYFSIEDTVTIELL